MTGTLKFIPTTRKRIDKYNGGYVYTPCVLVFQNNRLAYVVKPPKSVEYITINSCLDAARKVAQEEEKRLFVYP